MSELTPVTRKEQFLDKILQAAESGGGGGGSTLIEKSISANGVYNASEDNADGYSKVTVDVPNTYTAQDEGKVVDNGALVAQTTHAEITENGTYDITTNNSVSVNVSGGVEVSSTPTSFTFNDNVVIDKIEIPNGITDIGQNAFKEISIKNIVLPNTVTSIGADAFNSSELITINMPESITSIGMRAFSSCDNLKNIEIPSNLQSIAAALFSNCTSLEYIKFRSSTPPTVYYSNTWTGVPTTCIIYVPTGSLSDYTSAQNYPNSSRYTYVEY